MTQRVYNFSPGPATLPLPVLKEAQEHLIALPGVGISILEISHRSKQFQKILDDAKANIRTLLNLPDDFHIIFTQGGASMQFAMVPMNFLVGQDQPADYIVTGSWGSKAVAEAKRFGHVAKAWDGKETNYTRVPADDEIKCNSQAAYTHFTSNETIEGLQFPREPNNITTPLICDASSDIFSRPINASRYAMIYAGAQKNAGPAGVTMVLLRDDLYKCCHDDVPTMLSYRTYVEKDSLYNTPPVFAIYLVKLVTQWLLEEIGGLEQMAKINQQKAGMIYDAIDESDGFYQGCIEPNSRSTMNITFRLPDEGLEVAFLEQAKQRDLCELKGHRSVGGIRVSLYNAMPVEGAEKLRDFMIEFRKQ